jgi:hypothetical protein
MGVAGNANRDGQHRYLVRFKREGTGLRWYTEPLEVGAVIVDGPARYRVTAVTQPPSTDGLGHADAERATE